jgi:hypothetical protein
VNFRQSTHQAGFSSALVANENKFGQLHNMVDSKLSKVLDGVDQNLHTITQNM